MWPIFRKRLRYYAQAFPFTVNTFLVAAAIWIGHRLLYAAPPGKAQESLNTFRPFILLMGRLLFWFMVAILAVSLLSAVATWAWYLVRRRRNNAGLQLRFTTENKNPAQSPRLFVEAEIPGVRRPLLGFIKARLFYDDYRLTEKFALLSARRAPSKFWRIGIRGRSRIALPDIKEYKLQGAFVFFEDMLRLITLPVVEKTGGQFYQPPQIRRDAEADVSPKKTETLDIRIEQMRRVEGEPLNYKDFEAGDDVRRIVWKVYAKNRELVVRIPERFEPYASHLYFYASFSADIKSGWIGDGYFKEMLNYHKNAVWTVYDALAKKEWEMRYVPDQPMVAGVQEEGTAADKASRIISNSSWISGDVLPAYFKGKGASVLCISSLISPEIVASVLDNADAGTMIYYSKLSRTFRHFAPLDWLSRLLFMPPKDRLQKLRSRWTFSPVKWWLGKREKAIEETLRKSGLPFIEM